MPKTVVPLTSGDARRSVKAFGRSPRTTAVPLLDPDEYGSERWLSARRGMIGASEMAAVLGRSPYASPFSLWWSKQEGWELEQTLAMRLGHELEPIIAKLFAEARPDLLICKARASLWRHPLVPWMGCTPDYLAVCDLVRSECTHGGDCFIHPEVQALHNFDDEPLMVVEPVECKSDEGGKGWGRPGTDEVPFHHRVQALQQCAVFGAPRGHLVRMAGKRFAAYTVEYDEPAQDEMGTWLETGYAFVASLAAGEPPPIDGHDATTDTLSRLHPDVDEAEDGTVPADLADRYMSLLDERNRVNALYRRAQNEIRAELNDKRYGRHARTGDRFVDRRVFKRAEYVVASSMVDALYPVGRSRRKATEGKASDASTATG
jgi:putative phage-type endonuclease